MFQSIEKALIFLLSHNKINNQDYFSLHRYYSDLISSGSYDVDSITNDLKGLFDDNNYVSIILSRVNANNSVNSSFVNDVNQVSSIQNNNSFSDNINQVSSIQNNNSFSNNINQVSSIQNNTVDNASNKIDEKKVELVDVYDFRRGKQDYIKLTYSDGSVRILENHLDSNGNSYKGEEIFGVLKEKYGNDVTNVFHQFTKNSIEVNLYDFRDVSNKNIYYQLSQGEQQLIKIVMSQYPDKKILSGASSNMFVIQEVGKPDILVQVESLNGVYQVRPIVGITVNDELSNDSSDNLSDNDKSNSLGHQKTLSTPIGRMFSDNRESGFMMFVLFIFLAGISSGIIFMIILNFIA